MKAFIRFTALLLTLCCLAALVSCGQNDNEETKGTTESETEQNTETGKSAPVLPEGTSVTLTTETLRDKIAGSWVAQMVGVTWGAPTEFRYTSSIIPESAVPTWTANTVNDAFAQDDLYVEIPFIDAMKDNGVDCDLSTLAQYFADSKFGLAHANYQGRINLRNGISAPDSGSYLYTYHADDIDWQIEADFLGNFYPGLVSDAAARSFEIGHIMNYGDGVYGGVYMAAMHAAAFTTDSLEEVLEAGRSVIPENTKFRRIIDEVTDYYESGITWEECWQKINDEWLYTDKCPECTGSMNIDAKLNAAYVLMGLLWGNGDLTETMSIAMRCGQDSDCNPSSAAAILGTLYGLSGLEDKYVSATDYTGETFAYTDYTLNDCIDISYNLAIENLARYGITAVDGKLNLVSETVPEEVPYEQWSDNDITAYLTVSPRTNGTVSISSSVVLPTWATTDELELTLDMGDGMTLTGSVASYQYLENGTYEISLTAQAGSAQCTVSQTVVIDNIKDDGFKVTASCSESSPAGGGSRDISVIINGIIPTVSDANNEMQYDTYTGKNATSAWFALNFDHKVTVTEVNFSEGNHFENGGWFTKTPSVEVLVDGNWITAETTLEKLYIEVNDMQSQGDPYETFTFVLNTPTQCEGVRVIGTPGGSSTFASCSELSISYSDVENPTYNAYDDMTLAEKSILIVSETNPAGAGCKDAEIIRDGYIPKNGDSHSTVQYDTFTGRSDDHEEYYGYMFRGSYTVSEVVFTEGSHFDNGGWFKNGSLHLEALIDGEWEYVECSISPSYPKGDAQSVFGSPFTTYTFTPDEDLVCDGIRVIGDAGGSAHFTSCSELSVTGERAE